MIKSKVENISWISEGNRTYKQMFTNNFIDYLHTCIVNNLKLVYYTRSNYLFTIKKNMQV